MSRFKRKIKLNKVKKVASVLELYFNDFCLFRLIFCLGISNLFEFWLRFINFFLVVLITDCWKHTDSNIHAYNVKENCTSKFDINSKFAKHNTFFRLSIHTCLAVDTGKSTRTFTNVAVSHI